MATIIIQGTKEETQKTMTALRSGFSAVVSKGVAKTKDEVVTVVEVCQGDSTSIGFTPEQVMQGLVCCSDKERDCISCPYFDVKNCKTQMVIDAAVHVNRLCNQEEPTPRVNVVGKVIG